MGFELRENSFKTSFVFKKTVRFFSFKNLLKMKFCILGIKAGGGPLTTRHPSGTVFKKSVRRHSYLIAAKGRRFS